MTNRNVAATHLRLAAGVAALQELFEAHFPEAKQLHSPSDGVSYTPNRISCHAYVYTFPSSTHLGEPCDITVHLGWYRALPQDPPYLATWVYLPSNGSTVSCGVDANGSCVFAANTPKTLVDDLVRHLCTTVVALDYVPLPVL